MGYVLKCLKPLKVQLNALINCLVTTIVMTYAIMMTMILMVVTVVKMRLQRDGISTAMIVYVLKCQKPLKVQSNALMNGLVTTIVMTNATMMTMILMEEIVAKKNLMMIGLPTVTHVNALNNFILYIL